METNKNENSVIIVETAISDISNSSITLNEKVLNENIQEVEIIEEKPQNKKISKNKNIKKEILILTKLAVPIAISEFLKYLIFIVSNIFVGRIGSTELAGIALANTFCSSTGWHVIVGLGTALDTLCSQAFTAAKTKEDKKVLGLIVQRSFIVLFIFCIPLSLLWAFSEKLFLLLGQDEKVSIIASEYSKIAILALIPYILFDYLRRFIQTQGIVKPPFYIVAIITPINILIHYILINTDISPLSKEKRYLGAPISVVIVYWLLAISIIIYIRFSKAKECWAKLDIKQAISGWLKFLSLGIPGMFMVLTEVLAYEIFSLVAGIIGTVELAVQSVLISISSCVFNILIGISTAACVRIGNLLGSNNKEMAKFSTNISLVLAACVTVTDAILIIILRRPLAKIFTNDEEVIELASSLLIIMGVFELADGIVTPSNGILRGCGRQKIGAILNLVTYWIFGVPSGLILSLVFKLDLFGIWMALAVCLFSLSIIEFFIIKRTNWKLECEKAKKRYETQKAE